MANKKKSKKEIRKKRCITLSDQEVEEIKSYTGEYSLTLAIRGMMTLLKNGIEESSN